MKYLQLLTLLVFFSCVQGNHQSDSITHRLTGAQVLTQRDYKTHNNFIKLSCFPGLQAKVAELCQASDRRRARLRDSSQYLQFTWKADLVESWISEWDAQSVDCPSR